MFEEFRRRHEVLHFRQGLSLRHGSEQGEVPQGVSALHFNSYG
jgi:hypothetical protein